jgi:hypothetical protein
LLQLFSPFLLLGNCALFVSAEFFDRLLLLGYGVQCGGRNREVASGESEIVRRA